MLSSISKGKTLIENFSFSDDCIATLKAFVSLGVRIKKISRNRIVVNGVGVFGLKKPNGIINLAESGTSMRILIGLLCAQNFISKLDGRESLRKRPMLRVIKPLKLMGARINANSRGKDLYAPITISPSTLRSIDWKMSVSSAQVKSAILLAGLYAKGMTRIYEPVKSRDHTERMLKEFKAKIKVKGNNIHICPSSLISPKIIYIPADISSASFFIVLACLLKGSQIRINNLNLNPTRSGIINVLKRMHADIEIIYKNKNYFEPKADIVVKSSKLIATNIKKKEVPSLIDELPILMVAASFAKGQSVFEGIEELRVKETDRINSMIYNLSKMGAKIEVKDKKGKEAIVINGSKSLKGASLKSYGDHRTAMSMVVAALCAESPSNIDDVKCIKKSFPDFLKILDGSLF